ncbi:MAG: glycine cleavage T C-terminal barrel domain-containing protein, partial [Atribacterota bacterium]|nr:glycine cleavage T C-terminal barrel domain-containing protein [Atribacterota bacterium]
IDETINPLESGQDWTVKLNKKDFIGKESLLKVQQEGTKRKLVGLSVPQGGIPRHGMEVWYNNKKIGYITSGNYCPSLKKVYAMALIDKVYSEIGTKINVIIRNRPVAAEVVNIPFLLPVNKR